MSKGNEQTLKQAILKLMEHYQLKNKLNETKLISNWEKLMGKTISRYTKQIYIKDHKLYLKIDSAPLRQELTYAKEKIIEILNKEVGETLIKEVIISG